MSKGMSFTLKILIGFVMAAVVVLLISSIVNVQVENLLDFSGNSSSGSVIGE